jgi:hypothetical protein
MQLIRVDAFWGREKDGEDTGSLRFEWEGRSPLS